MFFIVNFKLRQQKTLLQKQEGIQTNPSVIF